MLITSIILIGSGLLFGSIALIGMFIPAEYPWTFNNRSMPVWLSRADRKETLLSSRLLGLITKAQTIKKRCSRLRTAHQRTKSVSVSIPWLPLRIGQKASINKLGIRSTFDFLGILQWRNTTNRSGSNPGMGRNSHNVWFAGWSRDSNGIQKHHSEFR